MPTFGNTNNNLDYMRFNQYMTKNPNASTANTGKFKELLNLTPPNTGGGLASEGWGDKFSRWFTPNEKGTSLGGQVLDGIGTGVDALTGLAGLYYADKNFKLEKEQADYLKSRDAASDARKSKFAANAGNGASY